MATTFGNWYGNRRYFGLHYDLHANALDTELGRRATIRDLVPMLRLSGADFVQTDCKGHEGMTSWFSRTPNATVSPGVRRDALKGWRAATRWLGLPLHCHYSGLIDESAATKHPSWAVIDKEGRRSRLKLCPRGPYVDRLMIPQMLELIDRYDVDGFWVDGEIGPLEPCYCTRCRAAYRKESKKNPPVAAGDTTWPEWMDFVRRSFDAYVTRYCDAVHQHKHGVLVCSNWLQTFKHPGRPEAPTDWISGDNNMVFGLDGSRCEARFLSTRGKPWDIMVWNFYKAGDMNDKHSPWTPKPPEMVMQEAAVVLSLGGNFQVYENPIGLRDGRLVPWRMKRIAAMSRFVKARRSLCQGTETIPQIAILHSERHIRASISGPHLRRYAGVQPVQGAAFSLLERHYGVDILDEWALLPRLQDFPVVVAPEREKMSETAVQALVKYVQEGGKLVVSGAGAFDRFGGEFLGVKSVGIKNETTYYVPAGDGAAAVYSDSWRFVRPTTARAFGQLGTTPLLNDRQLPHPAFVVNSAGHGAVAYVPCALFASFERNRHPLIREFIGSVVRRLAGRLLIRVKAPACVDVTLRRQGERTLIHLVNRASGIPTRPDDGTVNEIPCVGPIHVEVDMPAVPRHVSLAWEDSPMRHGFGKRARGGTLTIALDRVHIHAAIVIEAGGENK